MQDFIASRIKVVLVDDHGLFRFGLRAILQNEPAIELVSEFSDSSMLADLKKLQADVVVCDLTLGTESGIDIIKTVKGKSPETKVLVMSMHKDAFHIAMAIEAGADGYLCKDDQPAELIMGIKRVFEGERYFSKEVKQVWIDHRLLQAKNQQPFLTKKEKQVIHYIAKGMTSKQVAEKMNLSSRTVETHRYNILNKMNVKSAVELIKLLSDQKISY